MKAILTPYISIAEMLVSTFGSDCEVVMHDLDIPEHSVVYVANGSVTDRKIGDSFDQLVWQVILSEQLKENFVANYYFTAADGKRIRSSTVLIKGPEGRLEGALCINLDTTKVTKQIEFLQSFLSSVNPNPYLEAPACEAESDTENVANMIENLMDKIVGSVDPQSMTRENRLEKIRFMDSKGIF